ncbi:UNVERIFIED_CONTAM: hypothetical protein Sradi_0751500 [Sesamum radiatum]|uniref:Uncharacterized protein n=1 Tax=Sesamum radiatum TaxID=300843 RepID=A0AAW2VR46_SESRA
MILHSEFDHMEYERVEDGEEPRSVDPKDPKQLEGRDVAVIQQDPKLMEANLFTVPLRFSTTTMQGRRGKQHRGSSDIVEADQASQACLDFFLRNQVQTEEEIASRKETWILLRKLSQCSTRPWLCVGNYNEILSQIENEGLIPRSKWQIEDIRNCLEDCGLQDMGFMGYLFTWCNNREEPNTHDWIEATVIRGGNDYFPIHGFNMFE